jgi:hypothetical protein
VLISTVAEAKEPALGTISEAVAGESGRADAELSGQIVDATGGAIAGARVQSEPVGSHAGGATPAHSDAAGLFVLGVAPGPTRLCVAAEAYASACRDTTAPSRNNRIVLTPASSISGRLLAENTLEGIPLVRVTASSQGPGLDAVRTVTTDAEGGFRLGDLPAGAYSLLAISEQWRAELALDLEVAGERQVELIAGRAATLRGSAQVSGAPCAQGHVLIDGPLVEHRDFGAAGEFEFAGLVPGSYGIELDCARAVPYRDRIELRAESTTREWALEPGLTLSGVVLSAKGPMVAARVEVTPTGEPLGRRSVVTSSDERGEFVVGGLGAGDYDCVVGGASPRSDSVRVSLKPGSSARIELHAYGSGSIRARIEGGSAFDLSALTLLARGHREGLELAQHLSDGLVLPELPLGSYDIISEPFVEGSQQCVDLTRDGQTVEIALSLGAPQTLSGWVVDEQGQGVPDVWVNARPQSGNLGPPRPTSPVLSDMEGAFSLTGLLRGPYQIQVSTARGEGHLDNVPSGSRAVRVALREYGSVTGTLRDAAGAPVPEFVVSFARIDDGRGGMLSGREGAWSVRDLLPGEYQLTLRAARGVAEGSFSVAAKRVQTLALVLSPAPGE